MPRFPLPEALLAEFPPAFFSTAADDLETYGKDWSGVLAPNPSAIAFPRSTDEVARLLRLCFEHGIPVVPSGGRTGLSGGAVAANGELVLSLARMNRIGALDAGALTLEVEAGAITEAVHRHCEPHGLTWPVDFASKGSSCVGGNIATNAGGVRVIRYGLTRQWVLGLTVVLMDGSVLRLNGSLEKNNTGVDLRQVFIGSEGTLGVVTEAILKLAPLPREADTRVCFFALRDFPKVVELFAAARRARVALSAFECLTKPCLEVVLGTGLKSPFASLEGEVYALVEFEAADPEAAESFFAEVFERDVVLDGIAGQSARERAELWALRERVAEAILTGSEVHQQDLSVPIRDLEAFVGDIQARYAEKYPQYAAYIFGHIGDGNLHVFIRKPAGLGSAEFHRSCESQDKDLFELTRKFQGSISAEHGIGVLKKYALGYSRSADEIAALRGLKRVYDPKGLLNPGKIFD